MCVSIHKCLLHSFKLIFCEIQAHDETHHLHHPIIFNHYPQTSNYPARISKVLATKPCKPKMGILHVFGKKENIQLTTALTNLVGVFKKVPWELLPTCKMT